MLIKCYKQEGKIFVIACALLWGLGQAFGQEQLALYIETNHTASENSAYDLRYAANDARKMQEIIGARLKSG